MKKFYTKIILMVLLTMPLIYGCEKQEIMMSKEKISNQLCYTWKKLFTPAETNVTWQFDNGNVYIRQNETLANQGTYTVDCSVTKVKLSLAGFSAGYDFLNTTWQVISLDDEGLVITDLEKGIYECEFERKN
jgi:hypothetical protein